MNNTQTNNLILKHELLASIYNNAVHPSCIWKDEVLNSPHLEEWEYSFKVWFDENLSDESQVFFEQCVGYSATANVRGGQPSFEWLHDGCSCEVYLDITKSRRDDIGDAFETFWTSVLDYIIFNGSPIRKKDGKRLFYKPYSYTAKIRIVESDIN